MQGLNTIVASGWILLNLFFFLTMLLGPSNKSIKLGMDPFRLKWYKEWADGWIFFLSCRGSYNPRRAFHETVLGQKRHDLEWSLKTLKNSHHLRSSSALSAAEISVTVPFGIYKTIKRTKWQQVQSKVCVSPGHKTVKGVLNMSKDYISLQP